MAKNDEGKGIRNQLAMHIISMSYGELIKVGEQLASLKHQRLDVAEDFAKLLNTWAESQ